MDKIQILRLVVNERLTAAANEICGIVERTISEYEEDISRFKQEVDRQRRLFDAALQPQVILNRREIPQFTEYDVKLEYDEDPPESPAVWNPILGNDLLYSDCEMEEDDPPERQEECQRQQLSPDPDQAVCEQNVSSPSQDQEGSTHETPEHQELHDGCKETETPATQIDEPLAEGEQKNTDGEPRRRDPNRLCSLRICILPDPTIQIFDSGSDCRVRALKVRYGLQEEEFLKLLRTTFPQLADKSFDALKVDGHRKLCPLNLDKLTPERIIRSRCLGRSALYIRVKQTDTPMAEGEQKNMQAELLRSPNQLFRLRLCILLDPTMSNINEKGYKCSVKALKVRYGLQEEEFLQLLRTTFPQLADKPFDALKVNRHRKLCPLNLDKLTPERIIRSQCLGRSALYIRVKETDTPMAEGEQKNMKAELIQSPAELIESPNQLFKLRVCILLDPTMSTLNKNIPKECRVKVLKVCYGLQEEEFLKLLRTTFPQLADKPFDALKLNRHRKLCPLKLDKLTPEQIIRSRCLGRSALYIRVKAEDQCQTSQDGVHLEALEEAESRAENKGGDPLPSTSVDEEVKMVPVREDCGIPESPSQPVPPSGSEQQQEDCDEHWKNSWKPLTALQSREAPTERSLDSRNRKSVELPSTSLQAEGAMQHEGEDACESKGVKECQVSSDRFGVANGDDGSINADDYDVDADGADANSSDNDDDNNNDNDADDDDWKMSGGSDSTNSASDWKDSEGRQAGPKLKQRTRKNYRGCRRHLTHPPLCCKVCGAPFYSQTSLVKHAQTHADDDATAECPCGVCGQTSKAGEGLMDHLQSHTGDRPYQCDVCHKGFPSTKHLKQHAVIHLGEKLFNCRVCGKCYNSQSVLRWHRLSTHTAERNHACTECGKRFLLYQHLKSHMMVHSEQRPYLCDICSKSFKYLNVLNTHLKSHTGEMSYLCSVCGKCFTCKASFTRHMLIHTGVKPYSCSDCGQRFRDKSKCTEHKRCHTGEKPFACVYCSKTFIKSTYLTVHLRTHTGQKPYQCNVCGKAFTQGQCLKSHLNIHTWETTQES